MKKFALLILIILTFITLTSTKRWIRNGGKTYFTDTIWLQKPVQIGDSTINAIWIDSITYEIIGNDTNLLISTNFGIFKSIRNPGAQYIIYGTDTLKGINCIDVNCDTSYLYVNDDSIMLLKSGGGGELDTLGGLSDGQLLYFISPNKAGGDLYRTIDNIYLDGDQNTGFGIDILNSLTTGQYNTAIGYQSLSNVSTNNQNTAIGYQAAAGANASAITAVGYRAAYAATGVYNCIYGHRAAENLTSGQQNNIFGEYALHNNTSGSQNCAFGQSSLAANTGNYNTAIGNYSLQNKTSGNNNITLGYYAGNYLTTQSNLIIINSLDRSNLQGDSTLSPVFIRQSATTTNQKIDLNGNVNISNNLTAKSIKQSISHGSDTIAVIAIWNEDLQVYEYDSLPLNPAGVLDSIITLKYFDIKPSFDTITGDTTIYFKTNQEHYFYVNSSATVTIGNIPSGSPGGVTFEYLGNYTITLSGSTPSDSESHTLQNTNGAIDYMQFKKFGTNIRHWIDNVEIP